MSTKHPDRKSVAQSSIPKGEPIASGFPPPQWLSLTEALALLATGDITGLPDPGAAKRAERMAGLSKRVLRERQADPAYADFPASLPTAPASALFETLDGHRAAWPPSAPGLYREATALAADQLATVKAFDASWERLRSFARAGTVRVRGVDDRRFESCPVEIDPWYFSNDRDCIVYGGNNAIVPTEGSLFGPNNHPTYREVHVNRDELVSAVWGSNKNTLRTERRPRKPGAQSEAVRAALLSEFPNGVPASTTAKERDRRICERCRKDRTAIPSERTIQRVLASSR